jgi:hypothetical protein
MLEHEPRREVDARRVEVAWASAAGAEVVPSRPFRRELDSL